MGDEFFRYFVNDPFFSRTAATLVTTSNVLDRGFNTSSETSEALINQMIVRSSDQLVKTIGLEISTTAVVWFTARELKLGGTSSFILLLDGLRYEIRERGDWSLWGHDFYVADLVEGGRPYDES